MQFRITTEKVLAKLAFYLRLAIFYIQFVEFVANRQASRKIWHRQEKAGIIYWTANRKRTFLRICQPGAGVTRNGPSEQRPAIHISSLVLCLSTSLKGSLRGWNSNVSVCYEALHWVWHEHWHTSCRSGITRKSRPWTARRLTHGPRRNGRRWDFCTSFACFWCEDSTRARGTLNKF